MTTAITIVVVDGMVVIAAEKMAINISMAIAKLVDAWTLLMWPKTLRKVVKAIVETHILPRMVTVMMPIITAVAAGTTAIVVESTIMNINTVTAQSRTEVASVVTLLPMRNYKA